MKRASGRQGFRYVNESVGAFVLIVGAVAVLALIQSGRVQNWFNPGERLRVVLPQAGLFGLTAGSEVQVIGTNAGAVREINIDTETGQIIADVRIDRQFKTFIRTDSVATIRRKLAVAGDAYLEISRGTGQPLDWDLAVIEARTDSAPTDALNKLLDQFQEKAVPAFEHVDEAVVAIRDLVQTLNDPEGNFQRILANAAGITDKVDSGEGVVGRLIHDEQMGRDLKDIAANLNRTIDKFDAVADDLAAITKALRERSDEFPRIVERASSSLEQLELVLRDLKETTKQLPTITKNVGQASDSLPALTAQAQQTLREVEQLARQLRESWLVGGGSSPPPRRPTPQEAVR